MAVANIRNRRLDDDDSDDDDNNYQIVTSGARNSAVVAQNQRPVSATVTKVKTDVQPGKTTTTARSVTVEESQNAIRYSAYYHQITVREPPERERPGSPPCRIL